MNNSIHEPNNASSQPETLLLSTLVRRIQAQRGMSQHQLAQCLGVGRTTLINWLNHVPLPQLRAFLRLLELLPDAQRALLFANRNICRTLPALEHPRLGHDLTQTSRLRSLLAHRQGLTFIQGATAEGRTFLCHALAHAVAGGCGIDVHRADWYVPAPWVTCLPNAWTETELANAVRGWWQKSQATDQMLLLNGCYHALPGLPAQLHAQARRRHVIIADKLQLGLSDLRPLSPRTVHLLTVSGGENALRIHFTGMSA